MDRTRIIAAAAALALSACGLVNGLQGVQGTPGNSDAGNADAGGLALLTWHGPEQLDQGFPSQSDAPRLAWGQGKAWVAWQEYSSTSGVYRTWLTNRVAGQDFDTPQAIGQLGDWDGGAFNPNIAIGAVGDPVLIVNEFQAQAPGSGQFPTGIYAARLSNNLTVASGDLVRLDESDSITARISQNNSLAVDASGNAIAVWAQNEGVYASAQARGSGWTNAVQLDNTGQSVDVAAGAEGSGLASWIVGTSPLIDTCSPIVFGSGTLTPGTPKTLSSGTSSQPVLAMRGTKGMAISASSTNGLVTNAFNNGSWGPEVDISDTHLSVYIEPAVAINSLGQAVVVWRDSGGSDNYGGTLQAAWWNGSTWSATQQISAQIASPRAWWAQVDINDTGNAVVAWADFDSTSSYTRIWANVLDVKSGTPLWKGAVPIDTDSPNAGLAGQPENERYVGVALEPLGGHAQVVWMQHDSGGSATPRTWSNWLE